MKQKLRVLSCLFVLLIYAQVSGQEKNITGTVVDATNMPLPGVNIVVEGTSIGTQTDFDGNYTISARAGQTLLFTYIGLQTARRSVGASTTINVQMEEDAQALEEVVVTAQGIKREKKALGYSVTSVDAGQIADRSEGDVARVLNGKAAGVQITSAGGTSGSGTNVTIRGFSSFSGSNQALFIVDGIPFSGDNNSPGSIDGNSSDDFLDGNPAPSRFLDLDPNNIANVEVLKGLAATTLYGTLGRNGVILITTKAGAGQAGPKKAEITVTQSFFSNEFASLPDYQSQYGNGFDQSFGWFFSNWGPSFDREGISGWGNQAAIDDQGTLLHPYASSAFLNPDGPNTGTGALAQQFANQRYDWKPYNSVEQFMKPGRTVNTSINITGASEDGNTSFNVNMGHLDEQGFTPGNSLNRFNFSVGGRSKLSNKFTVQATANYARSHVESPPVAASRGNGTLGLSVFGNVLFTPRSVDLLGLPFENPDDFSSIYYRNGNDIINPNWTVKNVTYSNLSNRFNFNASLNYQLTSNLGLTWRSGLDYYNERNVNGSNRGGVEFTQAIFGFLDTYDNNNTIWDHYVALDGSFDFSDKIGMTFIAGATSRSDYFDRQGTASTGQIVYGVKRHFNYENQLPIQATQKRNIVGLLGQVSFDYDSMLFLNLNSRTDWVSNLSTENRSLTYPGVSVSFLPTAAFSGLSSQRGLNYLKLRAGYATSANFPTGYPTVSVVEQTTQVYGNDGGIITNQVDNFKANPDLKPELLKEFEVGLESRFLNNRLSLDLTYYDRRTDDLIVTQPLPPSTGFTLTQSNIGQISNKGYEAELGVDIFQGGSNGFNWNSRVNFFANKEVVEDQEEDIIFYAGNTALFVGANAAIEGESLGTIVGTAIARDEEGNFLVNNAGSYVITEQDNEGNVPIVGDAIPDYTMNFFNTLSYKNWKLNFQVQHVKGGDIMSSTIAALLGRGMIQETLNRENTFILPGVNQSTGEVNNKQINNSTYYFNNLLFGPTEMKIYDASVIRLQEVSLSYSFPDKFLDKTPFGSLTLTAQGFNLWYDAYNTPDGANFDPNVAGVGIGNGRGFDFMNGPSQRRYGFTVKASF